MTDDPFKPLNAKHITNSEGGKKWRDRCIAPIPPNAPDWPKKHPKMGAPSLTWTYRNGAGEILGFVNRFEEPDGGKSFRPMALFQMEDGRLEWRLKSWPAPRPLYHLDQLAARPEAHVLVVEGEKCCDAAERTVPDFVAVTSPGGSKSAAKADWSPLYGRDVVIWPDNDDAGRRYAEDAAQLLREVGARSISRISPPDGIAVGWDLGDAVFDGWTGAQVAEMISAAMSETVKPGVEPETESKGGGGRKRPRQRDALLGAADGAELWHDEQQRSYASIPVGNHVEHWSLASGAFRRWLAGEYYKKIGGAPGGQELSDVMRLIDLKAVSEGQEYKPFMRTGSSREAVWVDLADARWQAIKITAEGWEVERRPSVKFLRTEIMKPLPIPEAGYLLEELRSFVNVDDADYTLVVSWLIAALWGRATSYPVLALGGEQGTGKSSAARLLRSLIDPSIVETAAPPRDERDLIVAAGASHVLSFDNLSSTAAWLSDAVCRLSTGAGFLTRRLHTDNDASWFQGSRPIIVNGIPSLTDRADLAERSLTVRLKRIDDDGRQAEDEMWKAWDVVRPRVFAALLDALSGAMRRYDHVKLTRMPRMAAFAKLMEAASPALGWENGEFESAYQSNRTNTAEGAFEADPVAVAIREWMVGRTGSSWEGTATDLLAELGRVVSEDVRRSRFWPAKPNALGNGVDRAAPLLRRKGIIVQKRNTGAARMISVAMSE